MTATVTKTRTFSLFAFARINDTFSFDFRELIHYTVYFRHVMRSTYGKITYVAPWCVTLITSRTQLYTTTDVLHELFQLLKNTVKQRNSNTSDTKYIGTVH